MPTIGPTVNVDKTQHCAMLTRFITSQCDHGGYLCMGINNSLSLQQIWTSPSYIRLAGQTLENVARVTTPRLPSFLSLSPHSPTSLTFNQRDYKKKWSLKLNCHSNILLVRASRSQTPPSNIHKRRGAWAPAYVSTDSMYMDRVNYKRGSASGTGPT